MNKHNAISELTRYYNAGKIFRFFNNHKYIYKSIFRDLLGKEIKSGRYVEPRNIVLKLLSNCNATCRFCYAQKEADDDGNVLTLDEWKDVVNQAKKLGCYTVTLSGGEPLLYPYLLELIEYIKTNEMLSFTTTNGLSATPDKIRRLEKVGLCALNWSLHGPRDYHDAIVGIRGSFDKAVKYGEYGEYCAKNTKIVCIINHVMTRDSVKNKWYAYLWDMLKPKGFRALNLLPICASGQDKSSLLRKEELEVYDSLARENYVLMDTKNYSIPICPAAREDLFINNYGDVQPCPFIPISFGNIRRSSLKDIFINMQTHPMFSIEKYICVAARDNDFIDKYIMKAFAGNNLPAKIEDIWRQ